MSFLNNLAWFGGFELLALLTLAAAKVTLLLAAVALLCLVFRRFSAATRHLLWASVLCASLLMPFLSLAGVWEVPILPIPASAPRAAASDERAETGLVFESPRAPKPANSKALFESKDDWREKSEFPTSAGLLNLPDDSAPQTTPEDPTSIFPTLFNWALIVWLAGAMLLLFRLLIGFTSTNLLARRGEKFENHELNELFAALLEQLKLKGPVELLRSESTSMPVVCGVLRPVVLLPVEAGAWSLERQKMVLLHELTHVARRDCLTQMLAQIACAFYWFNPFVWFAERRLRVEREQACDDYVLSVGTRPSDYAQHLLEIARSLNDRKAFDWSRTATVAIARRSQLEGRLLAILSKDDKRGAMSRLTTAGLISLICLLLFSLALVRPTPISAHDPGNFADSQNNLAEKTPPQSFWSFGSADQIRRTSQETAAKQNVPEINEKSPESVLTAAQTIDEAGQTANLTNGPEPEPNIVREDTPDNPSSAPQTETEPQNAPAPVPFINIRFERERNSGGQERSEDFIDEMASVGYTNLSIDDLVRLKQAGVTAEYVRNLRALGFSNPAVRELASLSLHNVTPAYIQAIRNAGYNALSPRELTNFRIHDITPEYIKSIRNAGYDNLPARMLIDFATHGVSPAYIAAMRSVGFSDLSPRELVKLRVYDVTPDFVRKARGRLGELTLKQIVSLKSSGTLDEDKDQE